MDNDFSQLKQEITSILGEKTKIEEPISFSKDDKEFTYSNGIRTWVGALFLDIRRSSKFFKENNEDVVARVLRAYFREIINYLSKNEKQREIGLRGDCVYAIYSVPEKSDLNNIFDDAVWLVTFNKMFQKILLQNHFPTFSIGIGLGAGKDLIIKAGKEHTEYHDKIWIGDAVINASNLSSLGESEFGYPIYADSTFYYNIKDFPLGADSNESNASLFQEFKTSNGMIVYRCNAIKTAFNNWINDEFDK